MGAFYFEPLVSERGVQRFNIALSYRPEAVWESPHAGCVDREALLLNGGRKIFAEASAVASGVNTGIQSWCC